MIQASIDRGLDYLSEHGVDALLIQFHLLRTGTQSVQALLKTKLGGSLDRRKLKVARLRAHGREVLFCRQGAYLVLQERSIGRCESQVDFIGIGINRYKQSVAGPSCKLIGLSIRGRPGKHEQECEKHAGFHGYRGYLSNDVKSIVKVKVQLRAFKEHGKAAEKLGCPMQQITLRELKPELWPDLERFFQAEECSGCWCMNHRLKPGQVLEGEPARLALMDLVQKGRISGVLAFDQGHAIGWCAFDRMEELPGLDCGYPVLETQKDQIWSIHCISVLSGHFEDQVTTQMVDAAVALMKQRGATIIEANPPPECPSDNSFSGSIAIFEGQGFELKERVNKFYTRMVKRFE
jgi:hypothetical protein